jgi:hypothetical protein
MSVADDRLIGVMRDIAAIEAAPHIGRIADMWPPPDPVAEHARKREAVAAVLAREVVNGPVADSILDELIAAAETGV